MNKPTSKQQQQQHDRNEATRDDEDEDAEDADYIGDEDYSEDYEEEEDDSAASNSEDDDVHNSRLLLSRRNNNITNSSNNKSKRSGNNKNGESAMDLPTMVKDEIERRKELIATGGKAGPPNPLVVHSLRQYFESGKGDPMVAGGFMTLMREIGAVAQSKDHLVKHSEHNIWYLGAKGEEDTNEWWQDQLERHEAEVRLLRYGEFIEMQEIKGLSFENDWKFQDLDDKENLVGDDGLREDGKDADDDDDRKPSSVPASIDDDFVSGDQLMSIHKNYLNAFWQYANHEQIIQQQDQSEVDDTTTASLDQSQSSLLVPSVNGQHNSDNQNNKNNTNIVQESAEQVIRQRSKDLEDRYRELRRPLGYSLVVAAAAAAAATEQQEPSPAAKKMSGKKQRKRQRQQQRNNKTNNINGSSNSIAKKKKDHADCIREHLQSLLKLMDKQLLITRHPGGGGGAAAIATGACARISSSIVDMLRAGVGADPDIARTLANVAAPTIISLRGRAVTFALEADNDTNRPLSAGNSWWKLFTVLTMILADIIVTLTGDKENRNEYRSTAATPLTADEKLASRFFEADVSPSLLKSIQSPHATERCASLKALGRIVCAISVELAMGLVKPKSTWNLLEQACCMVPVINDDNDDGDNHKSDPDKQGQLKVATRAHRRDNIMAPRSAAQATSLLIRLCGTGMIKEESDGPPGMTIVPGPLARKMIQRGIVPFLMALSRSKHDLVSVDAVGGLAQISCVKDCRTSLLQQPDGVEWLQTILSSSEGHKVSQAVLLLRHLLWDDEWLDPILSIDPPIEQTIVRWMTYCMKVIRERADETRIASKKLADEFMARSLSKIKLSAETNEPSVEDQEELNAEIKAMEARLKNEIAWNKLETDEGRTHITNLTLSRGVIFLSTLVRDKITSERVLKANCLALGAACLDVPVDDTNSAAANIIGNYLSTAGAVPPNVFPDPDHVVRAAISRLSRLVNRQDITPRSFIFVRLLNGLRKNADWAPFFQSCAEQDMEHKYVIEVFLPKIGDNIPSSSPPKNNNNNSSSNSNNNPRRQDHDRVNSGRPVRPRKKAVRQATCEPATKLNHCDHCGVIEPAAGTFKKCSLCNVTYYCGRQCQTDAWKKHKKVCPTLAAQAKKKPATKKSNKKKAANPNQKKEQG